MTHKQSRIPEFKSIEEEAKWWETHELADYQDEFKTVKVRFGSNLTSSLNVRLDPSSSAQLRSLAEEKGVGPSTLVRMWVREHLRSAQ